ncbi:MAG: hypothetical protein V5B38_16285 [Candidatus Accumulibacter propinquus]
MHPYQKVKGKGVVSRDMNLHALPWPKAQLMALPPDTAVELRASPCRISSSPTHRRVVSLRSSITRPIACALMSNARLDATTADFVARINAAAEREDDGDPIDPKDPNWLLGDRQRHRGSLHQDIWHGTAAELASRGFIAVYPAKGWWRTRPAQERYDLPARYSLIVSIRTPGNGR